MSASEERYVVITVETLAGSSLDGYREYGDPAFRDEVEAWRGVAARPTSRRIPRRIRHVSLSCGPESNE